jgi:dipeptidyl aminopeptidase/acylaminoacyl peptidase
MSTVSRSLLLLGFAFSCSFAFASDPLTDEGYIRPPKEIEDIVLAPWYKNVGVGTFSPDRTKYVILESQGMPSIAQLGKSYVNLAGLQVDMRAQRARNFTTRTTNGLRIVDVDSGKETRVNLPENTLVSNPTWSPDGTRLAFMIHSDRDTQIYCADASTGRLLRITRTELLATNVTSFWWTADGKQIVTVLRPRGARQPQRSRVATTPRVRVSNAKTHSIRTYPSLLDTPADEAMLEFYSTGQLAVVDVPDGREKLIGKPAMYLSIDPSPDAKWFRASIMEKPFSRTVPMGNFPTKNVLLNDAGEVKVEISKVGLRTGVAGENPSPKDTDKREIDWRPDGAGLSCLELEPIKKDGDKSPRKDRIMLWVAPFKPEDAKVVYESENKINSVTYSNDATWAFITQTISGKYRLSAIDLKTKKTYTLKEQSGDEFYDAPGNLVTVPGVKSGSVALVGNGGKCAYLSGTLYSKEPKKEAPRPVIDRIEIETGAKTRIFESKADVFEQPTLLDPDGKNLLVNRQTATTYPNYFLVRADKSERQMTQNKDYDPDNVRSKREIIEVTRPDGFKFNVTVISPYWSVSGRNLPALFWFYPGEVADQAAYDKNQRAYNKNTYPRIGAGSMELFLKLGYALVLPDCPIVGPRGKENDTYISQLRNNLSATIDELDRREMVDRRRLAIGGHSYGAFSTANALVHTPFFKAGIAGDGNYLRPLTPFGFQAEGRQLWDDRELYTTMSPLMYAEQMTGALLMYHGMDDQNIGTAPLNAEKMFTALEALGKPASLYMYPYEDHGQIAKETRLDLWARMIAWLDKYVKNAK